MSRITPLPKDAPDAGPGVVPGPALDTERLFIVQEDVNAGSTGWMVRGACREADPELFFPFALEGGAVECEVTSAKAVCGQCDVRQQCLAYALRTMPDGIWGGTTREDRIAIRAAVRARPARGLH